MNFLRNLIISNEWKNNLKFMNSCDVFSEYSYGGWNIVYHNDNQHINYINNELDEIEKIYRINLVDGETSYTSLINKLKNYRTINGKSELEKKSIFYLQGLYEHCDLNPIDLYKNNFYIYEDSTDKEIENSVSKFKDNVLPLIKKKKEEAKKNIEKNNKFCNDLYSNFILSADADTWEIIN